jgi:hypothetical protein
MLCPVALAANLALKPTPAGALLRANPRGPLIYSSAGRDTSQSSGKIARVRRAALGVVQPAT